MTTTLDRLRIHIAQMAPHQKEREAGKLLIDAERMLTRAAERNVLTFQEEVTAWASATFPGQTPASKAAHLLDEAAEVATDPSDGEEMADCFILLLDLAEMHGYDLLDEAKRKMAKNRVRQWGPPDARGVCHHIEIGTEEGQACGRDGCAGIMGFRPVENCQCPKGNPPCSACTDNPLVCLTCGANPDEDPT